MEPNGEKYAAYWDPSSLLRQLAARNPPNDIAHLRAFLIISNRILGLHRSIDMARTLRCVSVHDGIPHVLVKRKGWKEFKWEQILSLPAFPHISPWHLMQTYVAQTTHEGTPGVLYFFH